MNEEPTNGGDEFSRLRGRLFGIAYRMLGSRTDAEDVVQESFVRWQEVDRASIRNPEAWLVTTATRIAIDRLRALQREREAYVGPWLPEPLVSNEPVTPGHRVELASELSIACLVLLERLAPEERAAFLLHDVFDCTYEEIAQTLNKSEAACRQIVHRARERVRTDQKRFEATEAARVNLLQKFTAAVEARDADALMRLFAPNAAWVADGGGRVAAAPRPVVGAERIAKLVLGIQERFARDGGRLHVAMINGETGLTARFGDQLNSVIAIDTDGDRISTVYAILNPDKLREAERAESQRH